MIAQVTAAALVSETKRLAHPASVDTVPTSANQEDHVSMACHGARRLLDMAENAAGVVAIELLAAAQGLEFHRPLQSSQALEQAAAAVRTEVGHYDQDRPRRRRLGADIAKGDELARAYLSTPWRQSLAVAANSLAVSR